MYSSPMVCVTSGIVSFWGIVGAVLLRRPDVDSGFRMMSNGLARHTSGLVTCSHLESGAVSAWICAWLPLRRMFVGNAVS